MNPRTSLTLFGAGFAVALLSMNDASAQTGVAPSSEQTKIIELSPFTVNTSKDVGYVAENTLAGSRLNTRLRDTASSVSVLTKEFLDDLAITDLREPMEYSVNGGSRGLRFRRDDGQMDRARRDASGGESFHAHHLDGVTVAEEIFELVDTLDDEREQQIKRWGARPHKISLFTAYDFKGGALGGLTAGGGWRWRSANVIGSDSSGREITGRSLAAADFMMADTRKVKGLPGRVRIQVNVSNLFDQTDIIPARLAVSASAPDGFQLPGGRGVAYSRYDLVAPRKIRLTTTYSFQGEPHC